MPTPAKAREASDKAWAAGGDASERDEPGEVAPPQQLQGLRVSSSPTLVMIPGADYPPPALVAF